MSDLLDKLRRRNLKVRELQNKYELGLHPFLKPENAMIYNPGSEGKEPIKIQYGDSQQSANTGSLSASDGVSKSGGDEDAKTETSHKKKYFDDFEYNDVLDDLYCKPFMDDEDWISSDEENDEERKNRSDKYRASNLASEDAKGLSDTSPNKSGEDSSSEEEETKSVNPEKVNWFKFIFSKHVKEDDPAYETLNSSVVTQTILSLLISDKTDEQIQEGLFENLGFEKIDMITEFISKRQFIKEYCEVLSKQINKEKRNQGSGYNPHQFSTGVTVSYGNKKNKKGNRNKKAKQGAKGQVSNHELLSKLGFSAEFIEENYKLGLKERNQNAIGYVDTPEPPRRRAQVFTAHEDGRKMGYKRDQFDEPDWTEIHLTPPARSEARDSHEKIQISELPKWAQQAFSSTTQLNTIQSIVFDCAFNSSKNVLVAAPTGAGKTNIALLTILREVKKYINTVGPEPKKIDMTDHPMKIVYLAPLKALAAEIVDKFTKALSYLKIKVREMTGDISLTKAEMKETHIIVSTPEKWDVVTRKSENVMNEVNLMIIDEIHLLNDERGTVLECLVSRALTTLIRNQKVIRILGLSATLPNYIDVADFIAAREDSTFYFDPSYRPTPLR